MSYNVHISQFDGPLDLLLHLIESAEVDIKDIFVSEITTQYLSYMADLDDLDMDTASEFLAMAATLLYIKSASFCRDAQRTAGGRRSRSVAHPQLREYKAFKRAGEELQALQDAASGIFTRLPEDLTLPPQEVMLSGRNHAAALPGLFYLLHAQAEGRPCIHCIKFGRILLRSDPDCQDTPAIAAACRIGI
jgi:segregation and condensation protein A